jgi:addiction module HigA family antidote
MSIRAKNRRPTHPGAILREDVLPSLDITQTDLADCLGVSRRTVSQILHEQRPLTVDMAIRLSHLLGTTPESWLNMQQALDIWDLQHKNARVYQQIERKAS